MGNPKESQAILLESISALSKVTNYKSNIQRYILLLYDRNKNEKIKF